MKISNQKAILITQFCTFAGNAMIGIFLPFFLMRVFDLDVWQVLAISAIQYGFWGILSVFIIPVTVRFLGVRKSMALGMLCNIGFLSILYLQPAQSFWLLAAMLLYSLYIVLFWVNNNVLVSVHTKDENRGNFYANFLAVLVGVNIIGPAITGFLLWQNLEHFSLWAAIVFQLLAIFSTLRIQMEFPKKMSFKNQLNILSTLWQNKDFRWGVLGNVFQGITMQTAWPFYFKFAVGNFAVMGILTSVMAGLEVFTAKLWGWIIDKNKVQKFQLYAVWARAIDLWIRTAYIIFNPTWFVALVQSFGTLLAPPFSIQMGKRTYAYSDPYKENPYDYFIPLEIFYAVLRVLIVGAMIYPVYLWGSGALVIFMALGGFSVFLMRRF